MTSPLADTISIKKYQIYSLSKCNSKELHSIEVCLNESKSTLQIYFEARFQSKEIKWKCIYLVPRRVTFDTKLRIFPSKILNNVLHLIEQLFKLKIFSLLLYSFCNLEDGTPMHFNPFT